MWLEQWAVKNNRMVLAAKWTKVIGLSWSKNRVSILPWSH